MDITHANEATVDTAAHPRADELLHFKIKAEQTKLLYRHLWTAIAFSLIVAPTLCLFQWSVVDHVAIFIWLLLLALITLGRVVMGVLYQRASPSATESIVWYRRFVVGAVLAGVAWGSAGVLLFPDDAIANQVFLAFVLGGMAAGAFTTLGYAWPAILSFLLLCILPLVIRLFVQATPLDFTLGAMLLFHLSGLSCGARKNYTNHLENIVLRLEAVSREEAINRFKLTLDQIHDCVVMIDPETLRCLYVNRGATLLLGYDFEELHSFTPMEIDPYRTEDDYRAMCASLLEQRQESITFETKYRHKRGHELNVETILQYVKPAGGHGRLVAVVRDISRRKQVERELIEARDAAQVATQTKSRFLATMSHEIRTPMNGVLGMAELLSRTHLDDRQHAQVDTIRSSAKLLTNLINDILDFSRIDAGKLELRQEIFDLELAVHQVVGLLAPQFGAKGLLVDVRYPIGLPRHLLGDEHHIQQVLMNLVGNAVKFTDSGQILIVLSGSSHGGKVSIRIEVQDTGIGIPPHSRKHLFELFTQADGSHSRRFGGTGLGLAISHALIDLMDGEIGVDSEEGVGSTFWVELTLSAGIEPIAGDDGILATFPALLVGAESAYMDTMAGQLDELGLEVVRATSYQSAYEELRHTRQLGRAPRFVLVDCGLPTEELATLLKTISRGPQETAIFLLIPVGHTFNADEISDRVESLLVPAPTSTLAEVLINHLKQAMRVAELAHDEESSSAAQTLRLKGSVLLVEDNWVNREVATEMLRALGLDVTEAENGREAIEKYRSARPDLVLMDGQMPELDGYEATSQLRRLEQGSGIHIPIVALTAHAFPEDRVKCLEAGMDDYLAKPFTIKKLSEVLGHWLYEGRRN